MKNSVIVLTGWKINKKGKRVRFSKKLKQRK